MAHVLIGTMCPFHTIATVTATALANMAAFTAISGHKVLTTAIAGHFAADARNMLIQEAHKAKASHLFMLDGDMNAPKDAITRLLALGKPIAGATYVARIPPHRVLGHEITHAPIDVDNTAVRRVHDLPTGCMLLDLDAIRGMEDPWFKYPYNEATKRHATEDYDFCRRAGAQCIETWLDPVLSCEIGHLGETELRLSLTQSAANAA